MFATNIVDHDIFVVGLMTINGVYLHHVIGQRFSVYQLQRWLYTGTGQLKSFI